MRIKLFIPMVLFALLMSSSACGDSTMVRADPKLSVTNSEPVSETVSLISIVKLIAEPDRFNGKRVQVIGFAHLEFEDNGIYLSKEDYEYALTMNGLWLSMSKLDLAKYKELSNSYLIVEGTFNAARKGQYNAFSGSMDNITLVKRWAKVGAKPQTGEE